MISVQLGEGWSLQARDTGNAQVGLVLCGPRGEGAAFFVDSQTVRADVVRLFIKDHSPESEEAKHDKAG